MGTLHIQRSRPGLDLLPAKKSFQELGGTVAAFCKAYPLAVFYGCMIILAVLVYQYARHTVSLYVDGEELCTAVTFSRTVESS